MISEFSFGDLCFSINQDSIALTSFGTQPLGGGFCEVTVSGENKISHNGAKMLNSSEGKRLKYVSHTITHDTLEIIQRSPVIQTKTVFHKYEHTNAISAYTEVTNITPEEIVLEEVSSLSLMGICGGIHQTHHAYLTTFTQSHHGECQARRSSLFDLGLFAADAISQMRVNHCNIGSWSTKEALPQGLLEYNGEYLMFQIESNNSWYYEISDDGPQLYLYLGGANLPFGGWYKSLASGQSYQTVTSAICHGKNLQQVIGEMTTYRRCIAGVCLPDNDLPTIFNEYMHLSWDSPTAVETARIAPVVASMGVKYYVIDCGWHNEEPGNIIYPYVGQWRESQARFPQGLRKTTDLIRSLGMKAGLWIEPEIIGIQCKEMLDYYDDDCFITRFGKKICIHSRYFLDYRNEKVREYMSESIRRMVEDYGADYIKMDYNQDLGVGTDKGDTSFAEGLALCSKAYLDWVDEMRQRFPQVLFETCSSGGLRMDYETLKHFSIISTSDQTNYLKYPYIAANILSGVLPEQAAVWSYPVDSYGMDGQPFEATYEWVNQHISREQVVMNMINSFLGRMHLASHIELLSEDKQALIREGVAYFDTLSSVKKQALPYFPLGFTDFLQKQVACGLLLDNKMYVAVWNLEGDKMTLPLGMSIRSASIVYPSYADNKLTIDGDQITVEFTESPQARFIEVSF